MSPSRPSSLFPSAARVLAGVSLAVVSWSVVGACSATKDPVPGQGVHSVSGVDTGGPGTGTGSQSGTGTGGSIFHGGGQGGSDPGEPSATCGDRPEGASSFSKQALLDVAGECAAWNTCQFVETTKALRDAVIDYADEPSEARKLVAQRAWAFAMRAYAHVAPFEFGPIAPGAKDPAHGRSLGAFIHSWPALSRCEVEKQVAVRGYESGFDFVPTAGRGLYALEYVLFFTGTNTVCASNSTAYKKWALMSEEEIAQAKRDYAVAVVGDLMKRTEALENVWATDGENFGAKLKAADGYASQQDALSVVGWSLLYPYEEVRDQKIGPRAAIGTAVLNPETPFADIERETVIANMEAFRALFNGCGADGAGLGYDDWLVAVDATDVRDDINASVDAIVAAAEALPAYGQASQQQMVDFYDELKILSDLLKGSLFGSASPLNIKLPAGAASDTD